MTELADLATEAKRVLDEARYVTRGTDDDAAWSQVGSIADYLDRIVALAVDPQPAPPPDPTPQPPRFILLVPNGGVFGRTKWLAGSKGCDIFLPRGTAVVAPTDCIVEEVIGGTGQQGGAEVILATPDRAWAWRYRHVSANVKTGQAVSQGQVVAAINDPSLDQLGKVPSWAGIMPDGWQHLDLSVDKASDQFAPTGGGGGNTDACSWLQSLNYAGRLLQRTPGPPDAGIGLEEAKRMMLPVGRR